MGRGYQCLVGVKHVRKLILVYFGFTFEPRRLPGRAPGLSLGAGAAVATLGGSVISCFTAGSAPGLGALLPRTIAVFTFEALAPDVSLGVSVCQSL